MNIIWKTVILFTAATIGIGSRYIFKKDDTIIEEVAEDIVCKKTGICVDFTPESKEK